MNDQMSPIPPKGKVKLLTFSEAMEEIINGRKVTRLEWSSNEDYGYISNGYLTIHTKGKDFTWTVRDVDMKSDDWCVLPQVN